MAIKIKLNTRPGWKIVFLALALSFFSLFLEKQANSQSEIDDILIDPNSWKSYQPSDYSPEFEEALLSIKNSNFERAKKIFQKLIFNSDQKTEGILSYLYLGDIYQKEGLFYEAKAIYSQFIKHYPDHPLMPEIFSRYGEIQLHLGEAAKAQKIFKRIIMQYPDTSLAYKAFFQLGDCLYESHDIATARLYYYEGMEKMPQYLNNHPDTAFNIGHLYLEDQQLDQSLQVFLNLEKNFPDNELIQRVVASCGDIYREQGKIQEALETYQRVINKYPDSIGAQVSKIRMADLGLDYEGVEIKDRDHVFLAFHNPISAYQELIKKTTTDPDLAHLAEYKLGEVFQKKEKDQEAIITFRSLLKKFPEEKIFKSSLYSLKQVLLNKLNNSFKAKDYFGVIKLYEKNKHLLDPFIEEELKEISLYFNIAYSYQRLDFDESAISIYKKIMEKDPSICRDHILCDQIHLNLSQIFCKNKNFKKALDSLKKISQGKSDQAFTLGVLALKGDIYYEQGDFRKAIESYSAALTIQTSKGGSEYLYKIAQSYEKLNEIPEAKEFLAMTADVAKQEKNTDLLIKIYLRLAAWQYEGHEYDDALKSYQELRTLPLSPDDKDWVLFQIGNCSQKEAKLNDALTSFEKLKASHQDSIWSIIGDFKSSEIDQGLN